MLSDKEIMTRGMKLLEENLGDLETERFISNLMQEGRNSPTDYTEWRHNYFDKMTDKEFLEDLNRYIEIQKTL